MLPWATPDLESKVDVLKRSRLVQQSFLRDKKIGYTRNYDCSFTFTAQKLRQATT